MPPVEDEPATAPSARRAELVARVGAHACVIDHSDRLTLRLDAEGRWSALRRGQVRHRRTLDGRVVQPDGHGWRTCEDDEAARVHADAATAATDLAELWRTLPSTSRHLIGSPEVLSRRLADAAAWTSARHADQGERFAATYPAGVSIVPPHRYRDLVVQPAIGCPHNRCTFCELYADRRFEVLDPARFAAHLRAVVELLGAAAGERDGVFFDSGTALSLPVDTLVQRLATCDDIVGRRPRGVAAFYDPDRGKVRSLAQWRRLVDAGLADATLGLETGDAALRKQVDKSADLARFVAVAGTMKAAGFRLAITVLVGLGGQPAAAGHRRETVARIAEMGLDGDDLVYLSRLQGALPEAQMAAQVRQLRQDLTSISPVRVGSYRIERFDLFA